MTAHQTDAYFRDTVLSATPEQLQLLLYEGAIRFARQGRDALAKRDLETSCEKLLRAQRIVEQMKNGLRPEVNPTLCEQLASLYDFIYWRLVDANVKHEPALVDDALKILEQQAQTWRILLEKLQKGETHPAQSQALANASGPVSMSFEA
jgi:flagellar protein FliS